MNILTIYKNSERDTEIQFQEEKGIISLDIETETDVYKKSLDHDEVLQIIKWLTKYL